MKTTRKKRVLSGLLCLILLLAAVPLSASAAGADGWDGTTIDVSWYNKTDKVFYLSTPEQFMGLAAIVNGIYNKEITTVIGDASCIVDRTSSGNSEGAGNNQSTDTYHYGGDDFNGKTIYLTADLNMGGVYDPATQTWSGPRYMPIGGQYLMEKNDASTKLSSSFCGTLDGQGHYILNIFCDRHCSTGNYGDGQSVGLIGRLGVHDSDPVEIRPKTPTVRNLAVTGYIYANRSVGGIVGKIGKTTDGAVIENCANYAAVKNTDAKGCGGIAGAGWNLGTIRSCFNAGSVSTTYVCPTGGISGSNEITVENCYNVGTIFAPRDSYAMAIGTNNGGGIYVDNCYWLTGSAPGGGYYGKTSGTVTELTEEQMKAASFVSKLGSGYAVDTEGKNGGYPILKWQAENAADPLAAPPTAADSYADVASGAWYVSAVGYVMRAGLFDLTGADTFSPEAPMTRLMLAEALYRLAGSPAAGASPFTDCDAPAVTWAYENGVVNGTGDGTTFSPDSAITREAIAAMFMRYAALTETTDDRGDMTVFSDFAAVSSWARDAASWAVGVGLINGINGAFAPQGTASRAEVAQMLLNLAG